MKRLMLEIIGGVAIVLMAIKPVWAIEEFYLKGGLGYGGGRDISLLMWTTKGDLFKTNVGGRNFEGGLGYKLDPKAAIEINIGYQNTPAEPPVSNGKGYFKKIPLTLTYIQQFSTQPLYSLYLGGGGGIYFSPQLYRELIGEIKTTCNYDKSFGSHILGRICYKLNSSLIFGEFKYVFVKYKFKEGEENGAKITPANLAIDEWRELNGNQWIFNIGFIYNIPPNPKKLEALYFDKAKATGTIDAYEDFLRRYPQSEFKKEASQKLEALYFDKAKATGTIDAYEDFLRRYPQSEFKKEASQKLEALYFDKAKAAATIEAYEDFLQQYPQSEFKKEASQKLEALYFDKAKATGTIDAYEDFLRRYPQSEFKKEASQKLEALYFDKAKATGTIDAYEDFLSKNPSSNFNAEATRNLQVLKTEIRNMEEAARKVLPKGAKVEVTTISRYPKEPEFVIAAHLLEGHSADETSPYVRGDYGTHEKLTRLVQLRCANIIKSIAKDASPSKEAVLVVSARHGVRQSYFPGGFGGTDIAMTIYEISIPVSVLRDKDVSSLDVESVMRLWEVRNNIIPKLQFQMQWGGF